MLVNKTLAEYLPDEEDPEYEKYAASVDEYRAQLEERYPPVCDNCIHGVQKRIRDAGYATKADNLRRRLAQSQKYSSGSYTMRQALTLAIIWFGKWIYVLSVTIALLWHAFGTIAKPGKNILIDEDTWQKCLPQAVYTREVDESCVASPDILRIITYALCADLLTIWWNPKLYQKTNRAGGRMRGLITLWIIRVIALLMRAWFYLVLQQIDSDETRLRWYHYTHGAAFSILLLLTYVGWKTVSIEYLSTKSLMQPLDSFLPTAPVSAEKSSRAAKREATLPNNTAFDTMAASFTSSFPNSNDIYPTIPPSPTLTTVSTATATTNDVDGTSPYFRRLSTARVAADDSMDWIPSQPRFERPNHAPHSIFAKPDPNPFRHKIPAAPKAPAASRVDPWRASFWNPPMKETTRNFFKEVQQEEDHGLQGVGVPKNVQREAELFASPKLKYDYYGEMKETGLEGSFNDLFSK